MKRTTIAAGLIAFGAILAAPALAAAPAQAAAMPSDPCFGGGGFGGGFGGFGGGGFGGGGFGGGGFDNYGNISAGSGFGHGIAQANGNLIGLNALNNVGLGLLSSANGF